MRNFEKLVACLLSFKKNANTKQIIIRMQTRVEFLLTGFETGAPGKTSEVSECSSKDQRRAETAYLHKLYLCWKHFKSFLYIFFKNTV